jgi:hypothetical protein
MLLITIILYLFDVFEYILGYSDIGKIYNIFGDIFYILGAILLLYITLYIINYRLNLFYIDFKKIHTNLIYTKSNYYLSIQLFNTFYNLHDFSSAILIFIALIQYNLLGKKINLCNYVLLNLYALIQSSIVWYNDLGIHKQNDKLCLVERLGIYKKIKCSMIKVHDILYLNRNNSIKVKEGIVFENDIVALNLGQTGERTVEEFKSGGIVIDGLIVKNHSTVKVKVVKTYSMSDIVEDNINTVEELGSKTTNIAFYTILLFTFIITDKKNSFSISNVLLDLIGCFIGMNYLIPSFKIQQSLNLWDSIYKYICSFNHKFNVCNHGDITIKYTPDNTVILSDKTGTLTNNTLTIEKHFIDLNCIGLLIGHINCYLDDDNKHTSHSPETNVLADFLANEYKLVLGNSHSWIGEAQIIDYSINNSRGNIVRHKKLTYKDTNLGSHSLVEYNNKYYHVFMGSKALLCNRLNYVYKINSNKRGLLVGFIELNNIEEFQISLETFRDTSIIIKDYKVIGELHYNNFYREYLDKSTKSGIDKLKCLGYPFYVITGDSLITAKDIGIELGIIHHNTDVIDGSHFIISENANEKENVILDLIEKRVGIFGNTRAIYKEQIVELFKIYNKYVVFLGDQENDYLAIKSSHLGIVQERGNKKCKNIANIIGKIPTETAYNYLYKYRSLGIEGKWWFYRELVRFNYVVAGIWLIGIANNNYTKLNLLFLDPWSPLHSLVMSILITLLLIYRSMQYSYLKCIDYNEIILYTPITSLVLSVFCGCIIILFELDYNIYSIPFITLIMFFG